MPVGHLARLAADKSVRPTGSKNGGDDQEGRSGLHAGGCAQALEPLVGDWKVEVKIWMAPDAPPTVSKGTAKSTWALKGRFVQQEFSGEFMGKPFRGISFTGYDNVRAEIPQRLD